MRRRCLQLIAALSLSFVPLRAQQAGTVSGALYASTTSNPVEGATVTVEDTDLVASSAGDGSFSILEVPVGTQRLLVEHPAFASLSRTITVEAGRELYLSLFLQEAPAESRRSSSREILRPEIASAAIQGLDLVELLTRSMPSIRVRDGGVVGNGTCIEYRGGAPGTVCRQLGLVVDGVQSQRPAIAFRSISLDDIERIVLLSPAEAGTRYGGEGGWGVLVVYTRHGPQQGASARPGGLIHGFDWSQESEPYRWKRVLLSAGIANGLGLVLSYNANSCLHLSRKVRYVAVQTDCGSWGTIGSVVLMAGLPSLGSALAARWAGRTDRSQGRFGPSIVIGTALTVAGYVALMYGDAENSPAASVVGVTVLTIGTPVFMTLADRLLRQLR